MGTGEHQSKELSQGRTLLLLRMVWETLSDQRQRQPLSLVCVCVCVCVCV